MRERQSLWGREQSKQRHRGSEFWKQMQNREWHHLALDMKTAQEEMWLSQMEGRRVGASGFVWQVEP